MATWDGAYRRLDDLPPILAPFSPIAPLSPLALNPTTPTLLDEIALSSELAAAFLLKSKSGSTPSLVSSASAGDLSSSSSSSSIAHVITPSTPPFLPPPTSNGNDMDSRRQHAPSPSGSPAGKQAGAAYGEEYGVDDSFANLLAAHGLPEREKSRSSSPSPAPSGSAQVNRPPRTDSLNRTQPVAKPKGPKPRPLSMYRRRLLLQRRPTLTIQTPDSKSPSHSRSQSRSQSRRQSLIHSRSQSPAPTLEDPPAVPTVDVAAGSSAPDAAESAAPVSPQPLVAPEPVSASPPSSSPPSLSAPSPPSLSPSSSSTSHTQSLSPSSSSSSHSHSLAPLQHPVRKRSWRKPPPSLTALEQVQRAEPARGWTRVEESTTTQEAPPVQQPALMQEPAPVQPPVPEQPTQPEPVQLPKPVQAAGQPSEPERQPRPVRQPDLAQPQRMRQPEPEPVQEAKPEPAAQQPKHEPVQQSTLVQQAETLEQLEEVVETEPVLQSKPQRTSSLSRASKPAAQAKPERPTSLSTNTKPAPVRVDRFSVPSLTFSMPSPSASTTFNHAISTSAKVTVASGRQAIVRRALTICRPPSRSGGSVYKKTSLKRKPSASKSRKKSAPVEDKRSVRVEMVDVDSFMLHWDAPELDPQPAWLASARGYVLEGMRLVIDIHEATPAEERKWLLHLAMECYLPMRQRYIDVMHVLRLSMPQHDALDEALQCAPPAPVHGMKRSEFKRAGTDPAPQDSMSLPRIVLPNPWRNTYRLLCNVAPTAEEPLWVPNGVVIDLTNAKEMEKTGGVHGLQGCIKLDPDTSDEAKSATMNTMLLHALRRLIRGAATPPPDVQRAISSCKIRRLSFHPAKVAITPVGNYGGVLDVTLPAPRGTGAAPAWHKPVRVYLCPGEECRFEYADTTPFWRREEIRQVVQDHIGSYIDAWRDIKQILGAFAPADPRLAQLFVTAPPPRPGYERRPFVARVTSSARAQTDTPPPSQGQRPASALPRLHRRREGVYGLEYPSLANIPPAALDCSVPGEPQVHIHAKAKHVTLMVGWLFSIVAAVFEG